MIQGAVGGFGRLILDTAEETGQFSFLVRSTFGWMTSYRIEWRQALIQMVRVGVESLPVHLVARPQFRLGRSRDLKDGADLITWFMPRSRAKMGSF